MNNKQYSGEVKSYNGKFGFLKYEDGEIFFHRSGILDPTNLVIGDQVEFKIEPSKKKEGSFQACEIILVKKGNKDQIQTNQNYLLGKVKWFDKTKGYGFISTDDNKDYFIHKTNLLSTTYIEEGDIVVFCEKIHNGKFNAIKCQPFLASLNKFSSEIQSKLLKKYLLKLGSINYSTYNKIKSIAQSDNIEEKVKDEFLKLAFEEASTEYQCQMLLDGIIILSTESQTELLNKYLIELGSIKSDTKYAKIKSIAHSDKIEEKVKEDFLKLAFAKASSEYQYKMLFEDKLIDLQNKTSESQTELLNKYLFNLGNINYSTYDEINQLLNQIRLKKK